MKTLVFEKLKSFQYLYNSYQVFRKEITKYSGTLDPENCEIDLKIHLFESVGEVPCRPIWHYDGTNEPTKVPVWKYSLYLTGDGISQTRFFVSEPVPFDGTEKEIHQYARTLEIQNELTRSLDYDMFHEYDNKTLHTAVRSTNCGERVLIRLKEKTNTHIE